MNRLYLLAFSLLINLSVFAHEFFFAYAEFEWNDFTETFQGTVIFTGHDLETALNVQLMSEDSQIFTDDDRTKLMDYINKHISLGENTSLIYVGSESKLTGEFYLYLETTPFKLNSEASIAVRFSLLMSEYPDQQNKMTLTYHGHKYYLVFLKNDSNGYQKITLDKKNEEK